MSTVLSGGSSTDVQTAEDENDDLDATLKPEDLIQRPKPAPSEWIEAVLAAHNKWRALHWTPPLIWSELCYEYAKRHADTCSSKGHLKYGLNDTVQGRLGQCCAGPGGPWKMNRPGTAEKIVEHWYKEISHYRFDHPAHHDKCANFEQVVWFGTTSVGMALSKDGKYVVANYFPAGPDNRGDRPHVPPGEKGRQNYFPPGHDVLGMTNPDKYHAYFKTNVQPVHSSPPAWLGGDRRDDSREGSPTSGDDENKKEGRKAGSPKPGSSKGKKGRPSSRSRKSGSPGAGGRKKSPAVKVEQKLMQPAQKSSSRGRMASPKGRQSPGSPQPRQSSPKAREASRERKTAQ